MYKPHLTSEVTMDALVRYAAHLAPTADGLHLSITRDEGGQVSGAAEGCDFPADTALSSVVREIAFYGLVVTEVGWVMGRSPDGLILTAALRPATVAESAAAFARLAALADR